MRFEDSVDITFRGQTYQLSRAALGGIKEEPRLKPADELLLNWAYETADADRVDNVNIYHDRRGVLMTCLRGNNKVLISDDHGHHQAAQVHLRQNFDTHRPASLNLFSTPSVGSLINLMQQPKSLDLFEMYLTGIANGSPSRRKLAAAFQTRHFTPKMLEIAGRYAGTVEQSRAYKKARLLILSDFNDQGYAIDRYRKIEYRGKEYINYYGAFSGKHIDYATQFLLEQWDTSLWLRDLPTPSDILDLACGNGIIGLELLRHHYPEASLVGVDSSEVAIRSAQENGSGLERFYQASSLSGASVEPADLIVCNPPFHDGHKNSIAVSLHFFERVSQNLLREGGHFVVVANRHLNYATHLKRLFGEVMTVADNSKFVIYRCR